MSKGVEFFCENWKEEAQKMPLEARGYQSSVEANWTLFPLAALYPMAE